MKASLLQQSRRSRSRYVFLLIGATALGLLVSCSTLEGVDPPVLPVGAEPTEENSWPQTQQSCESAGGRWEQLGILGTGCNLPTSDGGEPCGTDQVCTGLCLPTDPQTMKDDGAGFLTPNSEYIQQVNESGRDVKGMCSEWRLKFGCLVVVESGQLMEICID